MSLQLKLQVDSLKGEKVFWQNSSKLLIATGFFSIRIPITFFHSIKFLSEKVINVKYPLLNFKEW